MKFKTYSNVTLLEKYKGASTEKQKDWEEELEEIGVMLTNDLPSWRRRSLERREQQLIKKFTKQREWEAEQAKKKAEAEENKDKNESLNLNGERCPVCDTLLNDGGTCPKCDDGEEDYKHMKEELSVKEKLLAAFPELNLDGESSVESTEETITEELTNKEKLKRAFPELNFDEENNSTEDIITEELSNIEKLKRAYPELNLDTESVIEVDSDAEQTNEGLLGGGLTLGDINLSIDGSKSSVGFLGGKPSTVNEEVYDEYDDDFDMPDVEQDRVHATLYGGRLDDCCDDNIDDCCDDDCYDDVYNDEF